jgi:IS1 family transposase
VQRFFCLRCGKTFSESQPLGGIRTDFEQAAKIVHLLAETMGLRAISRFTGCDLKTIHRILESAGEHCARFLDAKVRNVKVPFVQADEVFSFIQQKPNGKNEQDPNRGSMWTFLSIAKDEKLIINYRVGKRTGNEAQEFLADLGSRMAGRFQLTTDAFRGYVATSGSTGSVKSILGDKCDYATETKHIKSDPHATGERIYFAPKLVKVHRTHRFGNPDMAVATICHCERTNLSLRTFTRRFVRRTINFSKKTDNHRHAVAIFAATFNFCRVHKSLSGKTPAMAAGLTDHVWTIAELLSATN